MRVGLETGQNWRDIARWNGIDNPNVLEVGQVLRVVAPGADTSVDHGARGAADQGRSTPARCAAPSGTRRLRPAAPPATARRRPHRRRGARTGTCVAPQSYARRRGGLGLATPANVATAFDEARTKGLVFAGKAGDPVLAAADGRVIYVGSGVRGYGNLVIVKHNNTYLTAYAHNQTLLVKEDQVVRRGQKIAEMGSSDAERVQLHFEIRKLGKPVDPARLLPPR